jgi:hypothetical protein
VTPLEDELGISYVEVLIAALLLGLALVPALDAFRAGLAASAGHGEAALQRHRLSSRMEEVLARPFAELDAEALSSGGGPSVYSDPPATPSRRVVTIVAVDGDNADGDGDPLTGVDTEILRVRVAIENSELSHATLVTQ